MLGLKRGTVKLVPHQAGWKALFDAEKQLLLKTFGETIIAVEHIGSTTIPHIPAKPIIDLAVGVGSLQAAIGMKADFERIGFQHRPNTNPEELYVKGTEDRRTHYAHVLPYGGEDWNNVITFRDRLIANPALAQEYAGLKQALAGQHTNNRGAYTEAKSAFISQILKGL